MKASELIQLFQERMAEHGDIEVVNIDGESIYEVEFDQGEGDQVPALVVS